VIRIATHPVGSGRLIQSAIAIQHKPVKNAPPLTPSLSQTIEDAYRYENSPRFEKNHFALLTLKVGKIAT